MEFSFASDNFSGVHPEVMGAIQKANAGHDIAYGDDRLTARCKELFKHHFGSQAEAFLVHNGTAANVCALKHVLHGWNGVLCSDNAHIWTDECGALSALGGGTLLPLPSKMGKLELKTLDTYTHYLGNFHHVQPGAVTITQTTEFGTLYTLDELKKIGQFAKKHKLLFHIDGARLANAAASLNCSLKALTTEVGVDLLSFGGTKIGLLGADAIVFLNPSLAANFEYFRKSHLQLASKMRFLSAQFIALLEHDLYLKNARHANEMAKLLESKLRNLPVKLLYPVEANALFVQIPNKIIKPLQAFGFFWIWDEKNSIVRWMTGWDTQPSWIDRFASKLTELCH